MRLDIVGKTLRQRTVPRVPRGQERSASLERIRLVLQKSGILRVEPVVIDEARQSVDDERANESD